MTMAFSTAVRKVVPALIVAADGTGDYDTIQAAIDALPATGGAVYVKEGTYTLAATVTIDKPNVTLEGAGWSTIITMTGANPVIYATGQDYLRIKNLAVQNLLPVADAFGIYLLNCDYCIIDNCKATASINGGFKFDSCNYSEVVNCFADTCDPWGINFTSSALCKIKGCLAKDCVGAGIIIYICSYCKIIDNRCLDTTLTGPVGSGIIVDRSEDCVVEANHCENNAAHGIHFRFILASIRRNTAVSNHCLGNTLAGIYVNENNDNIISVNVCEGNTTDGILLNAADNNNIIGNRCTNNGGYGINISNATCDDNTVEANQLTGNTTGALQDLGTDTQIGHNITV